VLRRALDIVREVFAQWSRHDALALGAALAYYTLFSMAPLLVLVIAIAGLAFGEAAAKGEVMAQLQGLMGTDGARAIEEMIARASGRAAGITATITSLLVMMFGASGVFGQLQAALNRIFGVTAAARPGGLRGVVQKRVASFGMVIGIGFLLLVSLVVSAALAALRDWLGEQLPVAGPLLPTFNLLVSFGVTTALFALIYKVLPDARLAWRDVWAGAAVTALLFSGGKHAIGLYLGRTTATSVYGAAGSLVLVLLWIYYSAQILFLGAEFTEVFSRRLGSRAGLHVTADRSA
jgi:membrane protein